MGDPARPVDERAGPRLQPLVTDVEGHLALGDVEGLVLVAMHVVGGGEPGRHDVVDEAEGAAGLLAGGLHYHEGAQEPHRPTFFPRQRVRLSAHIHGVLPSVGPCLSENLRVAESEVHPLYGLSFGTHPANFREPPTGEVRRTPLPRTRVNRGHKVGPELLRSGLADLGLPDLAVLLCRLLQALHRLWHILRGEHGVDLDGGVHREEQGFCNRRNL